jgi:hypothetical protein
MAQVAAIPFIVQVGVQIFKFKFSSSNSTKLIMKSFLKLSL